MKGTLKLTKLEKEDYELMLAWRNDKEINSGFYTQGRDQHNITWEEHCEWLNGRYNWMNFVIQYTPYRIVTTGSLANRFRRVGIVSIGQMDHWCPEIGYYVGDKTLWGQGIGKEAVLEGLRWMKTQGKEHCHTTVLDSNVRSVKLLKGIGFIYLGNAREGESWYQVNFSDISDIFREM